MILISAQFAHADDCENIKDEKICWDDGKESTLSWAYARISIGDYQIEARDFNWLGSVFLRVTHNKTAKEGMISEGEGFIFDFSNNSGFHGIKIIADEVSNINPMPANTGVYPNDPRADITIKFVDEEEPEIPELSLTISQKGETKSGSIIITEIDLENSGEGDIADTDIAIYYDGLRLLNEYDANGGYFSEGIQASSELEWENISKYRLTPATSTIMKDGFFIEILNFSNNTITLNAKYNFTTKGGTITKGGSIVFDFSTGDDFRGFRLFGGNFSSDIVELTFQLPGKNALKRTYSSILHGTIESIKLSFQIPASAKRNFVIRVNASGKDKMGNIYRTGLEDMISASDSLSITKWVSDSILGARIYPESYYEVGGIRSKNEVTHVNIRVDNMQSYAVHGVKLIDYIPPSFNFTNDTNGTSISWDFDINASDFREFRYELMARRPGVYNLPKADLAWNEWGEQLHTESDSPKTTVSGPYLGIDRIFNKSNIRIGEHFMVTLTIINNGDVPTNVTLKESVPLNATFLSGNLSFSGFLNPGETASIAYNLSPSGILEFKPPILSSRNDGFEWYAPLPQKKVMVMKVAGSDATYAAPEKTSGTITDVSSSQSQKGILEILNEKLPWLEGAVSMLALIFALLILIRLNKINRTL